MKCAVENASKLDVIAVTFSLICAVHCLLTPLLLAVLPLLATTFWVHQNFHLWMLLFVVPTTLFSLFTGCCRHRDRGVILAGAAGLSLLVGVTWFEAMKNQGGHAHCEVCAGEAGFAGAGAVVVLNLLAGLLLVCAHTRNFLRCRAARCSHGGGASCPGVS